MIASPRQTTGALDVVVDTLAEGVTGGVDSAGHADFSWDADQATGEAGGTEVSAELPHPNAAITNTAAASLHGDVVMPVYTRGE